MIQLRVDVTERKSESNGLLVDLLMILQHPGDQFLLQLLSALHERADELIGLDLEHAETYHLKPNITRS